MIFHNEPKEPFSSQVLKAVRDESFTELSLHFLLKIAIRGHWRVLLYRNGGECVAVCASTLWRIYKRTKSTVIQNTKGGPFALIEWNYSSIFWIAGTRRIWICCQNLLRTLCVSLLRKSSSERQSNKRPIPPPPPCTINKRTFFSGNASKAIGSY